MGAYDARIASTFIALGYDLFPFAAFDQAGRLRVPDSIRYPQHVREGLGRVASAPVWESLYRTVSVLDDRPWDCFTAGLSFGSRTVNLAVFKSLDTVRSAEEAHRWSISYQTTVAKTLRQFAGKRYVIDPRWIATVIEAVERLPASEKKNDPKSDPGGKTPGQGDPMSVAVGSDLPIQGDVETNVSTFVPWLLFGLRFLHGVLSTFTPKAEIRTTVIWYPTDKTPPRGPEFARRWTPLHVDYMHDGRLRAVHALWDPKFRGAPFRWGAGVPWSRWLWAMPHMPWQWCRAFYPAHRNCGGPGLLVDDELLSDPAEPIAEADRVGEELPPGSDGVPHVLTTEIEGADQ